MVVGLQNTILYLCDVNLLLKGQSGRFQYIQLLFLLRYPQGKCLKCSSKLIPLSFHFFQGLDTETQWYKLSHKVYHTISSQLFCYALRCMAHTAHLAQYYG